MVRCHPNRPGIVAVGLRNGKIYFINLRDNSTYTFDACNIDARIEEKVMTMNKTYGEDLGIDNPRLRVEIDQEEVMVKNM